MLSQEEVLVLARQHLYIQRPPLDWVWVLRPGKRMAEGWFFYYNLEPVRFIRNIPGPQFGGAPGFLVNDNGSIKKVGWLELSHLLPQTDNSVILPDQVSLKCLAETTGVGIYTIALLIQELKIDGDVSRGLKFDDAAKVLSFYGMLAKKAA